MKKEIYFSMLFVALLGMANRGARAQEVQVVDYPYGNYLNWQCDTVPEYIYLTGDGISLDDIVTQYNGQTIGYRRQALPFNFSATNESSTCTIYGIAIATEFWGNWNPDAPYPGNGLENDIDINIAIYEVTEGDTDLHLIKEYSEHRRQSQPPDKVLRFTEYRNSKSYLGIHEIYFDLPVTINGTFLVVVFPSDRWRLPHPHTNYCFSGYYAEVLTNKDKSILYEWYSPPCTTGARVPREHQAENEPPTALAVPQITAEMKTNRIQWAFPILVPYGTTAVGETRAEACAVRLTPNPAHGQVEVQSPHGIRAVELTDMAGRTLLRQRCDGQPQSLTLDISTLPQGVYAVKVETPQTTATEKLAVQ